MKNTLHQLGGILEVFSFEGNERVKEAEEPLELVLSANGVHAFVEGSQETELRPVVLSAELNSISIKCLLQLLVLFFLVFHLLPIVPELAFVTLAYDQRQVEVVAPFAFLEHFFQGF